MNVTSVQKLIQKESELFFLALGFLTRLPVPADLDFSQQKLNASGRYFTLVGWVIGGICALVYLLILSFATPMIAVLGAMLMGILVTGAFHEDGLADTADGLGGGWTVEQKLTIMKDSRLGTYGAVTLWFALSTKFVLLTEIEDVFIALLIAHPLSRLMPVLLIRTMNYVTDPKNTKVKPLAEKLGGQDLSICILFASLALPLVYTGFFGLIVGLVLVYFGCRFWLNKQLGGFTGDTLGASQQITELMIYFILIQGGL